MATASFGQAMTASILSQQLLLNVAEALKVPLMQIGRQAELSQATGEPDLAAMQATADMALRLVDGYTLGVRLQLEATQLPAEAVSVSSVLYDSGQQLYALAQAYGVGLEVEVAGRYGTVMAHREGLQAALVTLGASLIEALPALEGQELNLRLATHRTRYGIVAGLYTDAYQVGALALRRGRTLQTKSRQPFLGLTHTNGAGILVADNLLQAMGLRLRTSRYRRLYGLGTILQPNRQLQLV